MVFNVQSKRTRRIQTVICVSSLNRCLISLCVHAANIEHESIALFIKENGVRGIPHILVFGPNGKKLIGFGASFKKMDSVKRNLETIATSEDQDFVLDPVGHVVCRNSAWAGAQAEDTGAAL